GFVRDEDRRIAYGQHGLGIEERQTISQPYVVARMSEPLEVEGDHHVLEVGTGSGYQAAVLGELARDVVSVERHAALAEQARDLLNELGYRNVQVVTGDASAGYESGAPYDRILVTAASPAISPELVRQCAADGRLVAAVGDEEVQQPAVRRPRGQESLQGGVQSGP